MSKDHFTENIVLKNVNEIIGNKASISKFEK